MVLTQVVAEKYKPSVEIIEYTRDAPRIIASAGKQTLSPKEFHEIMESMNGEKTWKWIRELIRRGHGSPLEHGVYTFHITCSRVASHQLVRHRIASYTQLSQRYSDKYLRAMIKIIGGKLGVIPRLKKPGREDYQEYSMLINRYLETSPDYDELLSIVSEAYIIPPSIIHARDEAFLAHLLKSTAAYYEALGKGIGYEDARFLLPQAVKTKILVTMNARELIESFLPLRMCSHAQWEIRYIAWSIWRRLASIHPELFLYTGPRCVYMENRVRETPCSLPDLLGGKCRFTITRCPELVPNKGIHKCLNYASIDPWRGLEAGRD